jgi:hypothetical protein
MLVSTVKECHEVVVFGGMRYRTGDAADDRNNLAKTYGWRV